MATNSKAKKPSGLSWRKIEQAGALRKPKQRKRIKWVLLGTGVVLLACISVVTLYQVGQRFAVLWESDSQVTSTGETIKAVYFQTDGVLDEDWLADVMPLQAPIIALADYRELLLEQGQVKEASVELIFPNQLKFTIHEHRPVARLGIRDEAGQPVVLLVSETGEIYEGSNYPAASLRRLPFLDGVRLRRMDGELQPIRGMSQVTELLDGARDRIPSLARKWQVVDLSHYTGAKRALGEIFTVRLEGGITAILPASDFVPALDSLDRIHAEIQAGKLRNIEAIDLRLQQPVLTTRPLNYGPRRGS